MNEYEGSETTLVAKVDCTGDGRDLCNQNGIRGFPTIRYGDPGMLEEYQRGRTHEELKTFVETELKPTCSPWNIDLCDAEEKAAIAKFTDMGEVEFKALLEAKEAAIRDVEEPFKAAADALKIKWEALAKEKDAQVSNIKESGLSLMIAVKAMKTKKGTDNKAAAAKIRKKIRI